MATRLPAARRRHQLLDVALELFAASGFHATSMDDVAEAAGVTKPVLYQHFGSKEALYRELLEEVGNRLVEVVLKATAGADSPRHQVEAGFAAYFRFVVDQPDGFRLLFGEGARRREDAEAVRRVERAVAEEVAALIEADVDPDHRLLLASGIVGLAEATGRHLVAGAHQGLDPDETARRIAEFAWVGLRGVRPDGAPAAPQ